MPYQLGGAPPGLRGVLLSKQNQAAEQQQQLRAMQGALQMQGILQQRELMPLKLKQLEMEIAKGQQAMDMRQQIIGQMGGGGQSGQPMPQQGIGLPPQVQLGLLSGDPGMMAWAKEQAKLHAPTDKIREAISLGMQPGTPEFNSFIGRMATQGGIWNPAPGGGVSLAPGFAEGAGAIKGAEERAKAGLDLVAVPDGKGGTIQMPRSQAVQILQQQQAPAPQPAPQPAAPVGRPQAEQDAIRQVQAATARGEPARVDVGPYSRSPIPTSEVLGRNPSEAEKAADKERMVGREKLLLEKPDSEQRVAEISGAMTRLKSTAEELLRDPNLHFATGVATPLSYLPGTAATKTRAKIETLKSQVGLAVLRALREASKTGGALGQVSNFENVMMQQNLTALDRAQKPADFRKALIDIIEYANGASDRITGAYEKTYGEPFKAPAVRGVEQPKVINFGDL